MHLKLLTLSSYRETFSLISVPHTNDPGNPAHALPGEFKCRFRTNTWFGQDNDILAPLKIRKGIDIAKILLCLFILIILRKTALVLN